ncbi:MAG: hypothetical protein AB4426_22900 [Xenococcaceae cyanobacterium]
MCHSAIKADGESSKQPAASGTALRADRQRVVIEQLLIYLRSPWAR